MIAVSNTARAPSRYRRIPAPNSRHAVQPPPVWDWTTAMGGSVRGDRRRLAAAKSVGVDSRDALGRRAWPDNNAPLEQLRFKQLLD